MELRRVEDRRWKRGGWKFELNRTGNGIGEDGRGSWGG
jgi:hypothetical protein